MEREISPLKDARALLKLARACRDGRFDVVHTHTSKGGFLGRAAARLAGVPIVLHTAHGFAFHEASSPRTVAFYATLERVAGRWCDRIITVSEFHREWAIRLAIAPPDRIVTIRNGVSRERLAVSRSRSEVRRDLGIGDGEVVLVSIGRLSPQKGLSTLLDALPQVVRADRRVRVVLPGEGPLRAELGAQAKEAGLADVVTFLGFRGDVGDLLNASDVVVAPTLFEGLSISVLEAMAMAKPIVTTNIGSNLELIVDHESGLLVPPRAPELLAAAILEMLADPDQASRYGRTAKARFDAAFTEPVMKAAVWDLYGQLLQGRRSTEGGDGHPLNLPPQRSRALTVTVRPMSVRDVPAVVDVHLRAFPGFFLSFLGPRFLSVLYRSTVELGEIALVAVVDDRVTGLVMGSSQPGSFFRRLRRGRLLQFATASLYAIIRRPIVAPRLLRALRNPSEAAMPPATATLFSLAVDPAAQTQGIGRMLVRAFIADCERRVARRITLTTDKFDNRSVNAFYVRMGFRVAREITTPEGRVLYEYECDLPASQAAH